ncbi:MAG: CoA transferase [Acidimicrobiia bacterium]|nr:CoA transferase [Acidimicrobiia bacterium]
MHALEGVRVLDFGQYLAGPFGPMILADLGADVIKVEPITGDAMRGAAGPFFGCQRGKRSLALDVRTPRGLEIAHELVATADVVHHNMTQGKAERLGLDYERLRELKPDLIYCNTWAYGKEGPLSRFGGLDPLYQAASGLEHEAGPVDAGNPPLYYRFGMCGASNALLSVVGVLLALYHRHRTGEGMDVWSSLLNGGALFTSDAFLVGGEPASRPTLDKAQTGFGPGYRLYETQEGWIQVVAVRDEHWHSLFGALGRDDLGDDPRFADETARADNREALDAELEPVFRTRTALQWTWALDAAGVPNEVAVDTHNGRLALFDDDNVRLGLVAEYVHPIRGLMRQFGTLIDLSDTPGEIQGPPPLCGEHTREILAELGHDDAAVDALAGDGITYALDDDYRDRFLV